MGAKQDLKQEAAVMVPFAERMMFPSKMFKKICVFCGSSSGKKGVFTNEALNLGRELVCQAWWNIRWFLFFSVSKKILDDTFC